MENKMIEKSKFSRRKFLGTTAAATTTLAMAPLNYSFAGPAINAQTKKPDSKFNGVQLGAISYSWRSMPGGADNILKYCVETGVNTIELMSDDLESYLGAPENPRRAIFAAIRAQMAQEAESQPGQPAQPPRRPELNEEQQAQIDKYNEDVKAWRLGLSSSKVESVRKMFDDAGVKIHMVKYSPSQWSDEEIDYAFKTAKALGAKGVSEEVSEDAVKKLAPFAEKYDMYAVFHQHMQFATVEGFSYDPFLAVSPAVMMNFDAGHYFGSTGNHPKTIIEKYHDRIFSMHLKDKTGPNTDPANTNQVWGQGEMPLADVLRLVRDNKYKIHCDIELEYEVKPWSNAVKEVTTCFNYARSVLLG